MTTSRRVKIVCTMGPACRDPDILAAMLESGMDVARFNMSHGTHEEHAQTLGILRTLARDCGRPLALLQDLSGPKIRLGALNKPRHLHRGDSIRLGRSAEPDVIPVSDPGFAACVDAGDRLSLADGTFLIEVKSVSDGVVEGEIIEGSGALTSHKGVNVPRLGGSAASMSDKDREDLRFGLEQDFDWVAMSFVRSAKDAQLAREVMDSFGRRIPLLAKIEKPQALERIGEIVESFDGLLVARGDLGVETSLEARPRHSEGSHPPSQRRRQTRGYRHANASLHGASPRPTRAEVADVTAAVLDGTDAVMLSEETAAGLYPVEAIRNLASICAEAESLRPGGIESPAPTEARLTTSEGISRIVPRLAGLIGAKLIVAPTISGATARRVAAIKPPIPILALASNPGTLRRLALTWGVTPHRIDEVSGTDALFKASRREARATNLAEPGDRIVITAGSPTGVPGSTDVLKVEEV
jgi:pyruvate kinase